MFYEFKHSLAADYYRISANTNLNFPSHMHHCFEFLAVREGEMQVEVDSLIYSLHAGDALLIFPNQVHSMRTVGFARHVLMLFSPKLVSAYTQKTESQKPTDNRFHPASFYLDRLEQHGLAPMTLLEIKGILYSLCANFDLTATYRDTDSASLTLLYQIFKFIEQNYTADCTLTDLARHTGYDYAYLSHYFKKIIGISYHGYVTQYRISQACYLLQNTEISVLAVSDECGFHSLRSLNRNFKVELGITPTEYRRSFQNQQTRTST